MTSRQPEDTAKDAESTGSGNHRGKKAFIPADPGTPVAVPPVWRNPAYRRLWIGEGLSQVGGQLGNLAIPVLAVTTLGATNFEVGLLNAAQTVAFLVIGLPVGAWVDRMRKRRVLITADLVRATALASIPLLWAFGLLEVWQLYVVGAVVGGATVFFDVTYQSYVPRLVSAQQLGKANSGLEVSAQVARVGGPAISGALLSIVAAPLLVRATSVGYLFSFGFVSGIRDTEPEHEPSPRDNLIREIGKGLRFVFANPLLLRITIMTGSSNLFSGLATTLLPVFIMRELGLPPAVYGLVGAVGSIGGILGAMSANWLANRVGEGRVIVLAQVVGSLSSFLLPMAGVIHSAEVPLLMVGNFFTMYAVLVYNILQLSYRQRICPRRLLGRMNASIRFLVWGVIPVSGVCAGGLGAWLGVQPTMWIGCGLQLLACGILVFSPLRTMMRLPGQDATPTPKSLGERSHDT